MWTSTLADVLRFYHTACLQLKKTGAMKTNQVRSECLDRNHVGTTVRGNAVHQLLSFLCGDERRRQPEHCCRADSRAPSAAQERTDRPRLAAATRGKV